MKTKILSTLILTVFLLCSTLFEVKANNPPTMLRANIAGNRYNITELPVPKNMLIYRYHPTENILEIFHHFTTKDVYCSSAGEAMTLDFSYDESSGTIFLTHTEVATTPAAENGDYMHTGYIVLKGDAGDMQHLVFQTLSDEVIALPISPAEIPTGCWLYGYQGQTSLAETFLPGNNDIRMKVLPNGFVRFEFGEIPVYQLTIYNKAGLHISSQVLGLASSCELLLPDKDEVYIYVVTNKRGNVLRSGKFFF